MNFAERNRKASFFLLLLLLLLALTPHFRVLASSFLRFRDSTEWHTTVARTPLDEWSDLRRDLYLTNTQHSQQTNIHVPGGIRTRNPNRQAAADPRLWPFGHWDRQPKGYVVIIQRISLFYQEKPIYNHSYWKVELFRKKYRIFNTFLIGANNSV